MMAAPSLVVGSPEPRQRQRRRSRRARSETLSDIRRRQLLGEMDTTSPTSRSRTVSTRRRRAARTRRADLGEHRPPQTLGRAVSHPQAAAAIEAAVPVHSAATEPPPPPPPPSPEPRDVAADTFATVPMDAGLAMEDAFPYDFDASRPPTPGSLPRSTPPPTPPSTHGITPVSFADAFATNLPGLFADGDEPLPQLSSRAGTPVQRMRGLRSRDGMSRPTSRDRPLRAASLPVPDALVEWRPDSSDGLRPRRTPSARRRQDRALIRSRSSVSRTGSLSRQSLRTASSVSRGGLDGAGGLAVELEGPAADRADFFELWKEKQRHCTEEGDDAERPDSARNVYLESAMPHRAVTRCSIHVRLKHYSGGGAGSLRGGRMVALSVDANATVFSIKAQIRDRAIVAIDRQILFHDDVQLDDSSTIADLGLHRSAGPITLELVVHPGPESTAGPADEVKCHSDIAEAFGVVATRSNPCQDLAAELEEDWESSESQLRAIERKAKGTVTTFNPATGREKVVHCSALPLPLLVDHAGVASDLTAPSTTTAGGDRNEALVLQRNGQRMGNKMMASYGEGLRRLVAQGVQISEMHLANNWLSGEGTVGICKALPEFKLLTVLDLGGNHIGKHGAAAVADLLNQQTNLQTLSLAKCELGDRAAASVIQALVKHTHLTCVDLSHNGIGSTVLHPMRGHSGAPLSVQALADLMRHNSHISDLNLAWNSLSGDHVLPVMDALDENTGLKKLDLKWNGLGNEGAVPLGMAVRLNQLLEVLDVSHNDIAEKGTMVLADALKENVVLKHMCLDSNPIGPDGGRAVLRTLRTIAERNQVGREISINHCNLACEDGEDIFDPLEPGGHHKCNLADPYERVVANELVELAWKQDGENWESETLDGKPFSLPEPEPGEVWYRDDFALPEEGVLELTFVPTKRVPRMENVVSARVLSLLVSMMRHKAITDQGLQILRLACAELFFSSEQVAELISYFTDSPTRVTALAFLQQRIVDYMNWTSIVYSAMTDGELSALEQKIGQLFYFTPSNPTGRYRLNLANPNERTIARRIIEISSEEKITRQEMPGAMNTSQNGDWDNWRNESLDGHAWDYDEKDPKTSKLPSYGILQFDYVSTNVYHRMLPTLPISDSEFNELLKDLRGTANVVVVKRTEADKKMLPVSGKTKAKRRWKLARAMVSATQHVVPAQPSSSAAADDAAAPEPAPAAVSPAAQLAGALFDAIDVDHGGDLDEDETKRYLRVIGVPDYQLKARWEEMLAEADTDGDGLIDRDEFLAFIVRGEEITPEGEFANEMRRLELTAAMTVLEKENAQADAKARNAWWIPSQNLHVRAESALDRDGVVRTRQLRMLRRSTLNYFYSAAQVDEILTSVIVPSAQLEACIILFSRIIDLENHLPQKYLSLAEYVGKDYGSVNEGHIGGANARTDISSYMMRIGATNAFNPYWCDRHPMLSTEENAEQYTAPVAASSVDKAIVRTSSPRPPRPEGLVVWKGNPPRYDLRMGIFEDRLVCKIVVALASEADENWADEHMSGMPFKLSSSWAEAEPKCGVPHSGTVSLQLRCNPGTIDLSLRTGIARRLLMPGPGRWRCVPPEMVDQEPSSACINVCDEPLQKGKETPFCTILL
jgi:Ran GTPase-activating protein (RanGAP) involved in mRNA processing and transport